MDSDKHKLEWPEISKTSSEKEKSKAARWYEDTKFEIEWNFNHYIMTPVRNFRRGIENLFKYRKLIWEDRWWDYYFLLEMLKFKLKDMEEKWGSETHYVNDLDEKETLKKLIEDLEWMLDDENEFKDGYEEEYKKRSRSFFGRLDRNHRKLWD